MWTSLCFLSLYTVGAASSLDVERWSTSHPEFYKSVTFPWVIKEFASCIECPIKANYTWDYYFAQLLDMRVRNFILGGNTVNRGSRIERIQRQFYPPWDRSGFMSLKHEVECRGGRILADLGLFWFPSWRETFNKTAFLESVANFTKDYPVDGFILGFPVSSPLSWETDIIQSMRECFEAIKELRMVSGLRFSSEKWYRVRDAGLGGVADLNFAYLYSDTPEFITNRFARQVVRNATLAGVDKTTLILGVSLLSSLNMHGYSSVILDLHGKPDGPGWVRLAHGTLVYYNSQKKARDKLLYAKRDGLHGIYLEGGNLWFQDLLPWDVRSLCYALSKLARRLR
ncbi:hypothetical protein FOZ60_010388 [Perkinsus olseni]|uniref:Uncharacterized protein n=1 Tax=Perkinsus olseni TaxID=32597 RepID=A0A7J6NFG6_PEROL|nr:hypothetical protein FOZ60_010388 [Perkinsus olseni]